MRTTGPTLRRRNARWPRHQRRRVRARHEDEDHGDDGEHSEDGDHEDNGDHEDHEDSDSGSDADDEDEGTPRFFKPAVQPNAVVSIGGPGFESSTGFPGVTLGAGQEDLVVEDLDAEEEDEDEEEEGEDLDDSSSDSDDVTDGDQSSSDDDSDEETTLPPPGPPNTSTIPPAIAPPAGVSTIPLPPTATTSPSAGASPVLAPIGGIVGEPTATTSSAIPTGTTPGGIMSQVQPTTSTSTQEGPSQATSSPSATVPISGTITASPPPAADLPNPPTADFPNTIGGVDRIVTSTPEPTSLADSSPVLSESGGMETSAVAGITIGVLAFVGILLVGGWFLYKKWRSRDSDSDSASGLPRFLNKFRSSENRSTTYSWKFWDSNSSAGTRSTMGAPVIPPPQLPVANKKTNSEMVDDLMRAAYAAESGGNYNDLESRAGYQDEKAPVPAQVNVQTYKALFGNGPNSPMLPAVSNQGRQPANGGNGMMRWLDGTVSPHESRFGPPPSTAGLRAEQDWPPMPQQPQGNNNQPYGYR